MSGQRSIRRFIRQFNCTVDNIKETGIERVATWYGTQSMTVSAIARHYMHRLKSRSIPFQAIDVYVCLCKLFREKDERLMKFVRNDGIPASGLRQDEISLPDVEKLYRAWQWYNRPIREVWPDGLPANRVRHVNNLISQLTTRYANQISTRDDLPANTMAEILCNHTEQNILNSFPDLARTADLFSPANKFIGVYTVNLVGGSGVKDPDNQDRMMICIDPTKIPPNQHDLMCALWPGFKRMIDQIQSAQGEEAAYPPEPSRPDTEQTPFASEHTPSKNLKEAIQSRKKD